MSNKILLLVLGLLLFTTKSPCQTIGAYGAVNTNIIRESSEYSIDSKNLSPGISYSLGGYYKTTHIGKFGFMSFLDYSRLSNKNKDIPIISISGENLNNMEAKINNHYLSLSGLGIVYFGNFYSGIGLRGSVLLFSNTKMGTYNTQQGSWVDSEYEAYLSKEKFANTYYAPATVSIPIILGHTVDKFDISVKLNLGISNRLKGETFIKEFNNTVQVGVGYTLF